MAEYYLSILLFFYEHKVNICATFFNLVNDGELARIYFILDAIEHFSYEEVSLEARKAYQI